MLTGGPQLVGELIGTLLEPRHFHTPAYRALYAETLASYYDDQPIDALTIAEAVAPQLEKIWTLPREQAVQQVQSLTSAPTGDPIAHAEIVKRDADRRSLLVLGQSIIEEAEHGEDTPSEIAGRASQTAMKISTDTLLTHEILSFEEIGRNFYREQKALMQAREDGIETGAYFGLRFVDGPTRGLRPSELFILAGPPGSGKSAIGWEWAERFAERQLAKPVDDRLGVFVLSLEMSQTQSNARMAQRLGQLDGGRIREGSTTDSEIEHVMAEWNRRRGIPLYFNFTSTLKASQLRALIVESIRRHNVGLVVIDHIKYFSMDEKFTDQNKEDEAKGIFLKENLAKDLNLAVIALAHTTKGFTLTDDGRPTLDHLRGSGQVAADADFVGFMHLPFMHAKPKQIEKGDVQRTDAELIFRKNRHQPPKIQRFFFDASTMKIKDEREDSRSQPTLAEAANDDIPI